MSLVWPMDLPVTDKMVLLALADAANDEGVTWMAMESKDDLKLDLIKKTSLSRRAVQGALKRLCDAGYLSRVDRPGKGVIWTIKGCTSCAPQQMHPAPDAPGGAPPAPKPRINPLPLSEANASSREPAPKRGSRFVPEGFKPSPAHLAKAEADGITPGDFERALSRFRNHEFPRAYTDWDRCFTNWIDREKPTNVRPANDVLPPRQQAARDARDANLARAFRASKAVAARRAQH
jgi:hypothetical protein